jgi:hypothetical protein
MNYTTIEQSKELLELGLNPETADMHYPDYYFDGNAKGPCNTPYKEAIEDLFHVYINPKTKRLLPCWSLGALLEVMPKEGIEPFIESNPFVGYGNGQYRCVYLNGDWESSHQTTGNTLIEVAYNMVCWLIENGYIKKGE